MSEEKKFKKIYVYLIVFFLITNIIAVFFVFKKYRNFNKQENKIAKAKMKLAEMKEEFESVVDSSQMDSLYIENLYQIKSEMVFVDSLLLKNQLDRIDFESLQLKINDFVTRTYKHQEDTLSLQ